MPVSIVYSSAGSLTSEAKAALARTITEAHRDLTGTHPFLAQVNFQEPAVGDVYLGGVAQGPDNVFVHGPHRLGRPGDVKQKTEGVLRKSLLEGAPLPHRVSQNRPRACEKEPS